MWFSQFIDFTWQKRQSEILLGQFCKSSNKDIKKLWLFIAGGNDKHWILPLWNFVVFHYKAILWYNLFICGHQVGGIFNAFRVSEKENGNMFCICVYERNLLNTCYKVLPYPAQKMSLCFLVSVLFLLEWKLWKQIHLHINSDIT